MLAIALTALTACANQTSVSSTASAVGVRASGCSLTDSLGSGVAVGPTLIATSAHTVAGATSVVVVAQNGEEYSAQVVGFNPRQDVAVLQIQESGPFSDLGSAKKEDSGLLTTWLGDGGFETIDVRVNRLLLVTIEDIYLESVSKRRAFEIAAEVTKGDSGAPVYASDGTVSGIVYGSSRERPGIGFAVSALEIIAVVDQLDGGTVPNGSCP